MSKPPFKRIFVANRGEIAVRVIRACEELGIETVAGVSEADRESLPARLATSTVCIGPASPRDSYLKADTLVAAAVGTGCQAIHPGYGFLSEHAGFSALCAGAGVTFIGPTPTTIELMGDKVRAVQRAEEVGLPRIPGSGRLANVDQGLDIARRIGYPVMLKASAGGGGRGMRLVPSESDLKVRMEEAGSEALAAFGDAALYIEKFIGRARHIEIQILGDSRGNVIHMGERECSTQRRHQKLIEESPSLAIDPAMRRELADAATCLARSVAYLGAGTVEFLYDEESRRAYFLEMNTRIQVEHPVTEMVTERDLVVEQIRIAAGHPISFRQEELRSSGHAIECRINAEDPERKFAPSPGRLDVWRPPAGTGIRVDTHCFAGYYVPPYYDSLLAKLIVWGNDRVHAIERMQAALSGFDVQGIRTTIPFHQRVLEHRDFRDGAVTTRWVEETCLAAQEASRALAL